MKRVTKQPEEQVTVLRATSGSEQRFRYPAHEEMSEIACRDFEGSNENDQPVDVDEPVRAIAF